MSILIAYAGSHGCTEKCAQKVKARLSSDTYLLNLKQEKPGDLRQYDPIIIGGSIHIGKMQTAVKNFCTGHLSELLQKKIGLFVCCMEQGEKARLQVENAFPKALRGHAVVVEIFGGAFDFERMNFLQRAIIRKVANVDHSISRIKDEKISEFITAFQ